MTAPKTATLGGVMASTYECGDSRSIQSVKPGAGGATLFDVADVPWLPRQLALRICGVSRKINIF